MIPMITTFFISLAKYFPIGTIQRCEILWCFITEKEKNMWVKCTVLTETKHCDRFSGWIGTAIF